MNLSAQIQNFYPEYLSAHSNKTNRILHFIGTSMLFISFACAIYFSNFWLILPGIFMGYIPAGIGHKHFENNKSFRSSKPLLCAICSGKMYLDLLTGRVKFS